MKARDTRIKILESALQLFSMRGYLGATTKEIAFRAGVAEITLFRHFPSKEKLFEDTIKNYSFLPALKEMIPGLKEMDYHEALTSIAHKFLERLSERRELIRIMQGEMAVYPAKVKDIYQCLVGEIFSTLASYFRELQRKGHLREFQPELAARAFLGMFFAHFNSLEFLSEKKRRSVDNRAVIREFVAIFIQGTNR